MRFQIYLCRGTYRSGPRASSSDRFLMDWMLSGSEIALQPTRLRNSSVREICAIGSLNLSDSIRLPLGRPLASSEPPSLAGYGHPPCHLSGLTLDHGLTGS